MQVDNQQVISLMQYAFTRLDGAWFLAIAKKLGIEQAWELDIEAWSHFSYVLGKRMKKDLIPEPVWPDSFIDAIELMSKILKIEGRQVNITEEGIKITVTDCETQKMIARAGVADCGIVTLQTYQGIIRGLFGEKLPVEIQHTKNLNHGDDCCEVLIIRKD